MSQSSWKDQIKKKWGPHLHCPVCGKAMPIDRKFCSQGCKDNYFGQERKQSKKQRIQCIIMISALAVMMLILIIPAFLGG